MSRVANFSLPRSTQQRIQGLDGRFGAETASSISWASSRAYCSPPGPLLPCPSRRSTCRHNFLGGGVQAAITVPAHFIPGRLRHAHIQVEFDGQSKDHPVYITLNGIFHQLQGVVPLLPTPLPELRPGVSPAGTLARKRTSGNFRSVPSTVRSCTSTPQRDNLSASSSSRSWRQLTSRRICLASWPSTRIPRAAAPTQHPGTAAFFQTSAVRWQIAGTVFRLSQQLLDIVTAPGQQPIEIILPVLPGQVTHQLARTVTVLFPSNACN